MTFCNFFQGRKHPDQLRVHALVLWSEQVRLAEGHRRLLEGKSYFYFFCF
jgi:hypothetical protein